MIDTIIENWANFIFITQSINLIFSGVEQNPNVNKKIRFFLFGGVKNGTE